MRLKHELIIFRKMCTRFMSRKRGVANANIAWYLAIKYTNEAYIYMC